ncbi:MAG: hypothetical protein NTW07_12875 [candidate division Zixibacteria bacterium]|nr:hypothetical protein [candidate division Zixibacteria bacterium]
MSRSRLLSVVLLTVVIAVLCTAPLFLQIPASTRLCEELFNAGHAPLFGVIALILLNLGSVVSDSLSNSFYKRYVFAGVTALFLGIALELLQNLRGSDAQLSDVLRDAAGIVSFLCIAAILNRSRPAAIANRRARLPIMIVAVLIFLTAFISVASWTHAYLHRNAAFPTLASFDTEVGCRFLSVEDARIDRVPCSSAWNPARYDTVGQITFFPAPYSTFILDEPYSDWTGYSFLEISLFSPLSDSLRLTVRVHDKQHNEEFSDRFNATYRIAPGASRITVPLDSVAVAPATRPMDMSAIAGVAMFVADIKDSIKLYVDSLQLRR